MNVFFNKYFSIRRRFPIIFYILVIWILFLIVGIWYALCSNFLKISWDVKPMKERLDEAYFKLKVLGKQNEELKELFKNAHSTGFSNDQKVFLLKQIDKIVDNSIYDNDFFNDKSWKKDIKQIDNPPVQYEMIRRKIEDNMKEFWNFVQSEVVKAKSLDNSENSELETALQNILSLGVEQKRSLLYDLHTLKEVDGYDKWRITEASKLSDLIQRRLHFLQNPKNCTTAKKIVCDMGKMCGYGCQLHHIVYCLIMAYGTERTLILKSKGWRYENDGWEKVFLPISDTCISETEGELKEDWPGDKNTDILILPDISFISPASDFLPLAIPSDIAPRLQKIHGTPPAWWIGQILKYLLRPQPSTREFLKKSTEKLGFKKPIVGVHVRRTDKTASEAASHEIEEYMIHVEEYYNQLEMIEKVDKRRIYLATDEPKVIVEAKQKYPNYEILEDISIAKGAEGIARYTKYSLNGIILDIHLLSLTDYLVCTFSSQVCRVAYEIMQTLHVDASDRFTSLDDIYYFGGQNDHNRIAILSHYAKNQEEMHLAVGDVIGIAGNHWNGYSKGKNRRTHKIGLFPSFKTEDIVDVANFPVYAHVP